MAKEYEVRRDQILDAAEALFFTKSYSETSVEDVLQAVGIAKGTLYYYSKSKRDILNSLIDRMVREVADIYLATIKDNGLNAVDKLNAIYRPVGLGMQDGKDARVLRTALSQEPDNAEMWH